MSVLVADVLRGVFGHLTPKELNVCAGVCREWREVGLEVDLWLEVLKCEPLTVALGGGVHPRDVYNLHRRWCLGRADKSRVEIPGFFPGAMVLDGQVARVIDLERHGIVSVPLEGQPETSLPPIIEVDHRFDGYPQPLLSDLSANGTRAFVFREARTSSFFHELFLLRGKAADADAELWQYSYVSASRVSMATTTTPAKGCLIFASLFVSYTGESDALFVLSVPTPFFEQYPRECT